MINPLRRPRPKSRSKETDENPEQKPFLNRSTRATTVVVLEHSPPMLGGTPAVMYELLRHFPPQSLVLVTRNTPGSSSIDDRSLTARRLIVRIPRWMDYFIFFRFLVTVPAIISVACRLEPRRHPPGSILAVYPSLDFLLGSLFLSKILNVPLDVYLHDCIVETSLHSLDRFVAAKTESYVFRHARRIYSISEAMRAYYKSRGLDTTALPHGIDRSLIHKQKDMLPGKEVKVGFAGMIYGTNDAAFMDLIKAKETSSRTLRVLVATSRESVRHLQRTGFDVNIDRLSSFATHNELLDFLSSCDVLFLPLNFESPLENDLLTIFPTKVTDYWLAQRPILVYGPSRYAFVQDALNEGYALVVTERGSARIVEAIETICGSLELRKSLVNASEKMVCSHDGEKIAAKLLSELGYT